MSSLQYRCSGVSFSFQFSGIAASLLSVYDGLSYSLLVVCLGLLRNGSGLLYPFSFSEDR